MIRVKKTEQEEDELTREIRHVQRRIEQLSEWLIENDLLYKRGKITQQQYATIRDLYDNEIEENIKHYYELLKRQSEAIAHQSEAIT